VAENAPEDEEDVMEFMTVTGRFEERRYIAIYRKWFNDKLSAWELELVPGTLRWLV
jgi:hypothetical protein